MRKSLLLLLVLSALAHSRASAQITITAAELEALYLSGQTSTSFQATSTTGVQAIVDDMSANAVYDFSGLTYDAGFTGNWGVVTCSAQIPGCDNEQLAAADLVLEMEMAPDSAIYAFYEVDASGFSASGLAIESEDEEGEPVTIIFANDPPLLQFQFPLTAGTSWSDETTASYSFGGFDLTSDVSETVTVEGFGTLRTPAGDAPALKLRRTRTMQLPFGPPNVIRTIEFLTEGRLGASVVLDASGAPTFVTYSVVAMGGVAAERDEAAGLRLDGASPNPARSGTRIAYELEQSGPVRLTVYDALGREVAVLARGVRPAGSHEVRLEAGRLAAGVYVYTLEALGQRVTRSLVVTR